MTTDLRIAYNISNMDNTKYKLNVSIIDSIDKIIKSINKDISIEEFNSYMQYSDDENELINKANEIVKFKTAENIAKILKDDINEYVDSLKQSTTT